MTMDCVVACSNSHLLGSRLAEALGAPLLLVERRWFPDGELYLRIHGEPEGRVAVIQSLWPRPSEALLELLMVIGTLRGKGVQRVVAVVPYMAYMRQDSEFNPGEVVSARRVASLLDGAVPELLVTVDMHLHRFSSPGELFRTPVANLSAAPLLAREAVGRGLDEPVIVGPDEEAEQWARMAAEAVETEYTVFEKRRVSPESVEVRPRDPDLVRGRDVVIVDDIISTGGTVARAARCLLEAGAKRVYVAVTHALLVQGALARIYAAGVSALYATDTVETPYSKVSVATLLAEVLGGRSPQLPARRC